MKIGSLASGSGMLDEAVRAVIGSDVAWHAEHDRHASQVLEVRYPGIPNVGDVLGDLPPCDVLVGGLPCQPYSTAGRQLGKDDHRDLLQHLPALVGRLGPQLVFLENVAALNGSPEWGAVLGGLADGGYDCRWVLVRASDVGAPHQRRRLFAVAYPGGERRQRLETHNRTHRRLDVEPRFDAGRRDVATAYSGGARGRQVPRGAPSDEGSDGTHDDHATRRADTGSPADTDAIGRDGRAGEQWPAGRREPPHDHRWRIDGRDFGPAIARWEHITRVPVPPPIHGRNWCPRFGEWMMGWPIGWVSDIVPARHARRIIGNGVVPQQAEAAYRWLLAQLGRGLT